MATNISKADAKKALRDSRLSSQERREIESALGLAGAMTGGAGVAGARKALRDSKLSEQERKEIMSTLKGTKVGAGMAGMAGVAGAKKAGVAGAKKALQGSKLSEQERREIESSLGLAGAEKPSGFKKGGMVTTCRGQGRVMKKRQTKMN